MDAAGLTAKLRAELKEVDQRVNDYRQQAVDGFMRDAIELLSDAPDETYTEVRDDIVASLDQFPVINPALRRDFVAADSLRQAALNAKRKLKMAARQISPPPPPSSSRSDQGDDGDDDDDDLANNAGSAHDREAELHGLFTPSYLPLLDSSLQPQPTPPLTRSSGGGTPTPGEQESSGTVTPAAHKSEAVRRATDEVSTSSAVSVASTSSSMPPRSALRRSPSLSQPPQSPRRVRFDVSGTEVLPTTSPSRSAVELEGRGKDQPEDDDTHELSASKIWGDDDDEPPPKKISSTERLRALAKLNPDPNKPWPPFNEDEFENVSGSGDSPMKASGAPVSPSMSDTRFKNLFGSPAYSSKRHQLNGDEDDSSGDEFLSIPKPKSFANKKPIGISPKSALPATGKDGRGIEGSTNAPAKEGGEELSPSGTSQAPEGLTPTDTKRQNTRPQVAEDDDDIFGFEDEDGPAKERAAALPHESKDSDDESDEAAPEEPLQTSSSSAARGIPQLEPDTAQPSATTPTTPQPAKAATAPIVGSYKGKPITMPVVRDPDVQQQAASLGDFNSFVGGLDGRSGMDEADPSSFRASISKAMAFSGTPRSFSERLIMEEMEERRHGQQKADQP